MFLMETYNQGIGKYFFGLRQSPFSPGNHPDYQETVPSLRVGGRGRRNERMTSARAM